MRGDAGNEASGELRAREFWTPSPRRDCVFDVHISAWAVWLGILKHVAM